MVWFRAGLKFLINNLISDLDVGARRSRCRDLWGVCAITVLVCTAPKERARGAEEQRTAWERGIEGVGRWEKLRGHGWNCCG